jgi:prephenate dehydrogenase
MDVGSIKGNLVYKLENLMPRGVGFLGCHPIAGGESSGIEKSRAGLFEGALCVIVRTGKSDDALVDEVTEIWRILGSEVEFMTPEEHDRIFGLVSHFPHLAAYAMVNAVGEVEPGSVKRAGRGFLDSTRIALSSPEIWLDICMGNRKNLLEAMEVFKKNLDRMGECLKEGNAEGLRKEFIKARVLRGTIGD